MRLSRMLFTRPTLLFGALCIFSIMFCISIWCILSNYSPIKASKNSVLHKKSRFELPLEFEKPGKYKFNEILINSNRLPKKLLFLVLIASSAADPNGKALRDAIRKTWGNCQGEELRSSLIGAKLISSLSSTNDQQDLAKYQHCRAVFILGKTNNKELDRQIRLEASEHGDLIVTNVVENYRNMTLKLRAGLAAVAEVEAKYIVKADNDVYISLEKLAAYLVSKSDLPETLYGGVTYTGIVVRDRSHRHFVKMEDFSQVHYPLYCKGSMVVLSGHVLAPLIKGFSHVKPFNIDDAYLGIVLNKLSVTPVQIDGIVQFQYLPVLLPSLQLCDFSSLVGIGDSLLPFELLRIHENMNLSRSLPVWMCFHFNIFGDIGLLILILLLIFFTIKGRRIQKAIKR